MFSQYKLNPWNHWNECAESLECKEWAWKVALQLAAFIPEWAHRLVVKATIHGRVCWVIEQNWAGNLHKAVLPNLFVGEEAKPNRIHGRRRNLQ